METTGETKSLFTGNKIEGLCSVKIVRCNICGGLKMQQLGQFD
jgi:hypothetical protein